MKGAIKLLTELKNAWKGVILAMRRTTKPVMDNPFLARAIDEDPTSVLKAFESGLAVSLIATPRDKIRTCHVDEDLATVVARNRADRFDFLPVIEPLSGTPNSPDRIIGLVELWHYVSTEPTPVGSVGVHMQPLSEMSALIFAILGQYHIKGKKDWMPYGDGG